MKTETCFKLVDLAVKHMMKNHLANELPKAYRNLAKPAATENIDLNLITNKELMQKLRISTITLWRHRKNGMPHRKAGKKIYYDFNEVKKWMEG